MLHESLSAFAAFHQFIVYKSVPGETPGKPDKWPCDWRTGWRADAHNPNNWLDHESAFRESERLGTDYGVGFVFTPHDPFFFIDIDGAYDPIAGTWSAIALQLFQVFSGCAFEVSTSGTGAHIFGVGAPGPHSCKNVPLGIELYTDGRFVALTGNGAGGDVLFSINPNALLWLVETYFPPGAAQKKEQEFTYGPDEDWNGPKEDEELLRRAMASQSAAASFAGKASFADLWLANENALSATYPDGSGKNPYDASQADIALAQHLAFWTGRDCERIERLMWQSSLKRDKWEERADYYLPRTIRIACARQEDVLCDPKPETLTVTQADGTVTTVTTFPEFIGRDLYDEYFKGCAYIINLDRFYHPLHGILKRIQFDTVMGNRRFVLDKLGEKTTGDASEVWSKCQVWEGLKVNGTCFKPALPNGAVFQSNGHTYINTYRNLNIKSEPGDISRYLKHVELLLPHQKDRDILHSFLAFIVQYKGYKAQWAPVLQGTQGNGKTLFSYLANYMVGDEYTHWPSAAQLGAQFNGWMENKLLYIVEDIEVSNRRDVMEALKPLVTNNLVAIERKGVDQYKAEVCGNFIFNMNGLDGMLKTNDDRRYSIFYTAHQTKDELLRDGMTSEYFASLYDWLKKDGGYANVLHYYENYAIPDALNPAVGAQRAPETSSTSQAIQASMGRVEQEIQEWIDQGDMGLRGGWISSVWLSRKLEGLNIKLSPHVRKRALAALGYIPHPNLPDGRLGIVSKIDDARPRLYIKKDSSLAILDSHHTIERAYKDAQTLPQLNTGAEQWNQTAIM